MQIIFVFLCQLLRNFFSLTVRTLWPSTRCAKERIFFTKIEDRIFLEQYDEPHTSFEQVNASVDYALIVDKIHKINLHSINLNFMRAQRSESIEHILETINTHSIELRDKDGVRLRAYKSTDGIINKFSLKLNDPRKEQLYSVQAGQHANVISKLKILRLSIFSFTIILAINIYKLVTHIKEQITNEKTQVIISCVLIVESLIVYYII